MLPVELVLAVDAAAKDHGMNRSTAIRVALIRCYGPRAPRPAFLAPVAPPGAPQDAAAPPEPAPAAPAPPPPAKAKPGVVASDWTKLKRELDFEMGITAGGTFKRIYVATVFLEARVIEYPAAWQQVRAHLTAAGWTPLEDAPDTFAQPVVAPPPKPPPDYRGEMRRTLSIERASGRSFMPEQIAAAAMVPLGAEPPAELVAIAVEELRAAGWTPRDDGRYAAP